MYSHYTGSTQVSNGMVERFASDLPPPPVLTIPTHNPPRGQYPQSHNRLQGTHEQYQGAYNRDSKEHEHKVTPPPPYEEWQDDSHQNTIVIDNLPSDSSSIDESRLNNPVRISISSSSRSNTTSPSGDKESLEGAESLHEHSISSRSFLTPSPVGVHSHSQCHQGLPLRTTPSEPHVQHTNPTHNPPRGQYPQSHNRLQGTHEQYQGAYTRDSKEHEHKVTPPPPYEEWQDDSHQNTIVIDLPSDSSSIDESRLNNPVRISIFSSSRSNTTSPSGDKESLEGAESLHEHSISSRSFLTPSPVGVHSHSQSHQGLPLRSTASTPSGPVKQVVKRNATIPRNWYSESQQLQLSHSVGHIPARARRHSSSGAYMSTDMAIDGSGNLTMVSEV